MSTLLIIMAIIFVLAPLAQGFARRMNPPELPGVNPRDVARLREEVDQLTAQVNRLQDEQSFMVKLLAEGTPPARRLPAEDAAGQRAGGREEQGGSTRTNQGSTKPDTRDGGS